ncbi:MAG: hypothetical protein ACTFAL_09510 [Candidatus Electronema sp. V4]|uniref:hypothetical protein n=1 Tax=Candidatus Electronema sp. V4 TaxID=3454756 RepID=UPI0040555E28
MNMSRWLKKKAGVLLLFCSAAAVLLAGTAQAGAKEDMQMKRLQHAEAKLEREIRQLRRGPAARPERRAQANGEGSARISRSRQAAISDPQKAAGAEELLRKGQGRAGGMMPAIMWRQADGDASALNPQRRAKLLRQKKEKLQRVKAARAKLEEQAAEQDIPVASRMTVAQVEAGTGSISGRMTNAAGEGLAGSVYANVTESDYVGTTADAEGYYTISGLSAGSYKVDFYPDDARYQYEWYNDKDSFEAADAVAVTEGNTTSGINAFFEAGGSISGRMTDAGGNGLAGWVYVYDLDYNWIGEVSATADGSYTVSGLRAGSYKVEFDADDVRYSSEWHSNKASFDAADAVAVTSGVTTANINAELEVSGSISGRMTDAGGNGLAGWVYVYDLDYNWAGEASATADGSYTVSGLRAGSYKVEFDADDVRYLSEWHSNKASFDAADAVAVTSGVTTANINADLEVGGSISGKMTDAAGNGLAGWVDVYDLDYNWTGYDARTVVDGSYTVSGLRAGSYKVLFYADDESYIREWYNDKDSFESADAVAVTSGGAVSGINAELAVGGSISGKMTDAAGAGVSGYVQVDALDGSWAGEAWTAADGSYTVSGLRAGSYKVEFDADDVRYLSEWYDGSSSFGCADEVVVASGVTTANINAHLEVGGSISGRMTDAAGAGVSGYVQVYALDGSWAGEAWTAADGSYTVSGLRAGSYKVEFDADDVRYSSEWHSNKASFDAADAVAVTLGVTTANINADLEVGGSISGRMNAAGAGVSGYVQVYALDGSWAGRAWTADGSYTVSGLRAGSYKVEFDADDVRYSSEWHSNKASFDAADAVAVTLGVTTANINADLEVGGSISGRMNAAGAGVSGYVQVYILEGSWGSWAAGASTEADGSYTVSGLRAGSYKVMFDADDRNYAYEWYNDKASFDAADAVAVTSGGTTGNINATFEVGGSISGRMTNAAGAGVAGYVQVYALDGSWAAEAWTGSGGSYTVWGLRTGSYKVRFMPYGNDIRSCGNSKPYVDEWYNNKRSFYVANPVQVTAPNVTTGIDAKVSTETKALLPILNLVL